MMEQEFFDGISNDDADKIVFLLTEGENVNEKDEEGWTPLIMAAWYGNFVITYILLKAGADIDSKNSDGDTALVVARKRGNDRVAKLLQDMGAK